MTMNKRLIFITIFSAILLMPSMSMAQDKQRPLKGWKLVWKEDFKGNSLDTEMLTFIIVVFTAIFAAIAWHHFKKWRKRKLRRLRLKEFTKKMRDKGRHI